MYKLAEESTEMFFKSSYNLQKNKNKNCTRPPNQEINTIYILFKVVGLHNETADSNETKIKSMGIPWWSSG